MTSAISKTKLTQHQVMLRQDLAPYATPERTKESVTHYLP